MAKIKLSELPELTSPSSNTENTFVLVTDMQSGTPLSRKMSVKTLDTLIDVTQGQANLAFARANASFEQANASLILAAAAFNKANTGSNTLTNLTVTGNIVTTGNITSGNITPSIHLTSNLGNANFRFHSLFLGPNSLDVDGYVISNSSSALLTIKNNTIGGQTPGFVSASYYWNNGTNDTSIAGPMMPIPTGTGNALYIYGIEKIILPNGFDVNEQANAAFAAANSAISGTTDTYARNHSNSAFIHANSAFAAANAAGGTVIDAYARDHANAAFVRANNSLDANNGGDVFGLVSFYGNIQQYNGTANVNHLHVQQPYIYVNAGGQSPVDGRMNIVFQRGSSYYGVPNAVIGFNETSNTFQMTNGSGVFSNIAFEPYTAANLSTDLWATSPPATLQAAIERLANAVIILRGYNPIP